MPACIFLVSKLALRLISATSPNAKGTRKTTLNAESLGRNASRFLVLLATFIAGHPSLNGRPVGHVATKITKKPWEPTLHRIQPFPFSLTSWVLQFCFVAIHFRRVCGITIWEMSHNLPKNREISIKHRSDEFPIFLKLIEKVQQCFRENLH